MYDLVIEDALICDGTGTPAFHGSVAVRDGLVAEIERGVQKLGGAKRRMNAEGRVLSPGFVDPHTHYDAQIAWDPLLTSSPWHGVTTVMFGNCGVGVAPLPEAMREIAMADLQYVEDIPYASLAEGVDWQWESFGEYLDVISRRGVGINVAGLAPLTPMRQSVMGEDSMTRAASDDELVSLKALFRNTLREGAFGWSSTRVKAHIGNGGRPVACRLADLREYTVLSEVLRSEGRGVAQIAFDQPELGSILDETLELLRLLHRVSGRPTTYLAMVNHPQNPRSFEKAVGKLGELLTGGGVVPQMAINPITVNFRLSSPQIIGFARSVLEVLDQPLEKQIALYESAEFRAAVQRDLDGEEVADRFYERVRVLESGPQSQHHVASGRSIAEIAADEGKSGIDCLFDLALADRLETQFSYAAAAFDDEGVANLLRDGRFMPGLSDGGAHVQALNDTGYATHMLAHWVRETEVVTLEEGIRMLTSMPADFFGIARRGRIQQGHYADLALFDPETVAPGVPTYVNDLPGGLRRLVTPAQGIAATFVNGEALYVEGAHQENLPGRVLRSTDR